MNNSKRIDWVDLLKGFAILWLVVYHFYAIRWLRSPVPVFFFLSGMFYSDGASFGVFIRKKAKALIVPFLFFFALGVMAAEVSAMITGSSHFDWGKTMRLFTLIPVEGNVKNPLGVGAIWFLPSLFELYLFYWLMRRLTQNKLWLIAMSVMALVASCLFQRHFAMGSLCYLFYSMGFLVYFVAGNLLKDAVLEGRFDRWLFLAACLGIATIIPTLDGAWGLLRYRAFALGCTLLLVQLFKRIPLASKDCFFRRLVLFEGRNSLTILGTHLVAMGGVKIMLNRFLAESISYWVMMFIFIVIVSNLTVVTFNRYVPYLVNHK